MSVDYDNEIVIRFGDEVKATGDGKVRGYLVRFGGQDLEGDVFSPQCDFGRPMKIGDSVPMNLYYAHGMDPVIGKKAVGTGRIVVKEAGLWYEGQIQVSDQYREMIKKLAVDGRLGFSSGAAGHLVVREKSYAGDSNLLTVWPLAEASLTPRPAEPRNLAFAKSLSNFANMIDSNEFKAEVGDLKVGDNVRWQSSGGMAQGRITAVSTNGQVSPKPAGKPMMGTEEQPAYQVRVFETNSDGDEELSDVLTVHRAGTLTKIENPMKCGGGYPKPLMMPMPAVKPKMRMPEVNTYSWMYPRRKRVMSNRPSADEMAGYGMGYGYPREEEEDNMDMCGPKKKPYRGEPDNMMNGEGNPPMYAPEDMEGVNPQVLSSILSHLMMAYQEMLTAINEGEVEEEDMDEYHSTLMNNVDTFGTMLRSYMFDRRRSMKEAVELKTMFAKSKPTSVTEYERRVREAFSLTRREAKMLASHGWKALCDAVEEAEVEEVDVKSTEVQPVEEVVEETTEAAESAPTDEVVVEAAEEVVVEESEVAEVTEETEEPVQEDVKSYDDEETRRMRDELTRKLLAQRMQI
jgi:hypothetical protein